MYELKIANGGEKDFVMSVDSPYHNHRFYPQWHKVIEDYQPQKSEIELQKDDLIKIRPRTPRNTSLGYGLNERTRFSGFYPLSRVKNYIKYVEYPGLF